MAFIRYFAIFVAALAFGRSSEGSEALRLYHETKYEEAIKILQSQKDTESIQLLGQSWFMLGEFKKASEAFEKANAAQPADSDIEMWLGRAYGRRAETANPLFAPKLAVKARQHFERAVDLDPRNVIAMNDLFEYYFSAPGFLGGGKDKAAALSLRIAQLDKAEGHYTTARLAEDRKEFNTAEQQLRRAVEEAPSQVGRILDLAKFLAKQGRSTESEAEFQRAEKIAPNSPKICYTGVPIYFKLKKKLPEARTSLKKYLEASLTPHDPSRQEAEKLIRSAGL